MFKSLFRNVKTEPLSASIYSMLYNNSCRMQREFTSSIIVGCSGSLHPQYLQDAAGVYILYSCRMQREFIFLMVAGCSGITSVIIIIIKRGWQCKTGRERLTLYQSEDPNPTTPTHRKKEEKGKTVGDKKGASS